MSSFQEFLNEELKDPAVRFWWHFYGPYYGYRMLRIKIETMVQRQKCCRRRRKTHECKRDAAQLQ